MLLLLGFGDSFAAKSALRQESFAVNGVQQQRLRRNWVHTEIEITRTGRLGRSFSLFELIMKKVGPYQLTGAIDHAEFGTVYAATDLRTQKKCTAKVFPINQLTEAVVKQIQTELLVLKQVSHPHVIHFYDMLRSANNVYLIIEDCSGGDLHQYIEERGPLDESTSRNWLGQIVAALKELFEVHHILHRDLKPDNIMLGKDGHVLLVDFGLSKKT